MFRADAFKATRGSTMTLSIMKRKISWIISGMSFFVPSVWAYFAIRADDAAQSAANPSGPFCGNVYISIIAAALCAAGILAFVALILNFASMRQAAKKGIFRYAELLVIGLPLIAASVLVTSIANA
jgi:hypothetical protein